MKPVAEGWPRQLQSRRRAIADYVRALDSVEQATAAIERMLKDWSTLDDQLKGSLLHSAIVHYARPFSRKRDYGGKRIYQHRLFDLELHAHILSLRNKLIAHQDSETLRAQVGHAYSAFQLSGTSTSVLIGTYCVVKALHCIENKIVAERFLRHLTVCVDCLKQIVKEQLATIYNITLQLPAEAAAEAEMVGSYKLPITEAVVQTRIPTLLEMGAVRIPDPEFPLPADAYKYRVSTVTHVPLGKYEIATPEGQVVMEISDLPFEDPPKGSK
jgi:hypothetical protein